MLYVGVDLHKKTITLAVFGEGKRVRIITMPCSDTRSIRAFFAALGAFQVVVEATAGYEWFVELVEPLAKRVVLAHPGKLRVIAESTRKSDRLDAQTLAEFLAKDMIPEAYRPTPRQREHRRLMRHREHLRRRTTACKNRIRRLFADYNADGPTIFRVRVPRDQHPALERMSSADRFALNQLWRQYDLAMELTEEVDREIRAFAAAAPPAEAAARAALLSIVGVGFVTAEAFLCEIGDLHRFRSQKQVVAYVGLAPGQRESAGKKKELGISHRGSRLLRWALNQAAWQLQRHDPRWRQIFDKIAQRRGRKRAITALSRRLLCVMVAVVNGGEMYRRVA